MSAPEPVKEGKGEVVPLKTLCNAYLCWFPFGLLGAHHFYLERYFYGFVYFFTFGMLGIGWLIDLFALPSMVREANLRLSGQLLDPNKEEYDVFECYRLLIPLGFLGLHHFYLRRYGWGTIYIFTFALCGVGFLIDIFELPSLVREANEKYRQAKIRGAVEYFTIEEGFWSESGPVPYSVLDAYKLAIPFGILGLHQWYLGRPRIAFVYFFTFGLGGLGWLYDLFAMPWLVDEARRNKILQQRYHSDDPEVFSLVEAYRYWLPFGFLGAHYVYLKMYGWAAVYFFTFGLGGFGFLLDLCHIPTLVKRANENERRRYQPADGEGPTEPERFELFTAYKLYFPFGIIGFHYFYLEMYGWFIFYFLTLGVAGLGFLRDLFFLPTLVREANLRYKLKARNDKFPPQPQQQFSPQQQSPQLYQVQPQPSAYGVPPPYVNPQPPYSPQGGAYQYQPQQAAILGQYGQNNNGMGLPPSAPPPPIYQPKPPQTVFDQRLQDPLIDPIPGQEEGSAYGE